MRVNGQQARPPSRLRSRRSWSARAATGTLIGALTASAGCSLIAELADQSFHQPIDAGTAMFTDAMAEEAGRDGSLTRDSMAPPTPGVFVVPPCNESDAGGWQLDCAFGDGGFVILPNVQAGSQAPVVSVNADSPAQLVLAGVLADDRTSFVAVIQQGMIDEDYGIAEIATTGAPAGVAAVPGTTGNAYAALAINAIADAGDGQSGAQGIGFVVVFDGDAGALQQTVFDPSGAALTAFDVADFNQDTFEALLVANRAVGLSAQPALVRISLDSSGAGAQFTYVDTRLQDGEIYYPATSSSLGFVGGFIGTSQSNQGTLYEFDDAGVISGIPTSKVQSPVLAFNGGVGTFGSDLGVTGVIGFGVGVGGIAAQFFVPPLMATSRPDYAAAGSAPPGISPDTVRYVHGIESNITRYAVAVKSEVATRTSFVSLARFDIVQGTTKFEPTSADGGLFSIEFASPMKLGAAFYYLGDICAALLIENNGAPNAAAIACFKTNGQVIPDGDSGTGGDAGREGADATTQDASDD